MSDRWVDAWLDMSCETPLERRRAMRAFSVAALEGRLHPGIAQELGLETGSERCLTCGMLHWDAIGAHRCCRRADRAKGNSGVHAGFATVTDAARFQAACRRRCRDLGFRSMKAMAEEYGMDYPALWHLQAGSRKWIQAADWARLTLLFGGTPPGCEEANAPNKEGYLDQA